MKVEKYRITQKPKFRSGQNALKKGNASLTTRAGEPTGPSAPSTSDLACRHKESVEIRIALTDKTKRTPRQRAFPSQSIR
jgi:hypothetical protein